MINKELAKKKQLSKERVIAIEEVTKLLQIHLARWEMHFDPKTAVSVTESFENVLQELWGFGADTTKHKYQTQLKGCTCPSMDNDIYWGTELRWRNNKCPLHGEGETDE